MIAQVLFDVAQLLFDLALLRGEAQQLALLLQLAVDRAHRVQGVLQLLLDQRHDLGLALCGDQARALRFVEQGEGVGVLLLSRPDTVIGPNQLVEFVLKFLEGLGRLLIAFPGGPATASATTQVRRLDLSRGDPFLGNVAGAFDPAVQHRLQPAFGLGEDFLAEAFLKVRADVGANGLPTLDVAGHRGLQAVHVKVHRRLQGVPKLAEVVHEGVDDGAHDIEDPAHHAPDRPADHVEHLEDGADQLQPPGFLVLYAGPGLVGHVLIGRRRGAGQPVEELPDRIGEAGDDRANVLPGGAHQIAQSGRVVNPQLDFVPEQGQGGDHGGEDDQECAQGVRGDGRVEGDHRGADRVERSRAPGDDSEARAHRQEDLGDGVQVIADEHDRLGQQLARAGRLIELTNQVHHVVLKDLEGLADGGDGLGKPFLQLRPGVLEGVEDDVSADFAILTHLPEFVAGHVQLLGNHVCDGRQLFQDGVQFIAAEDARGEALGQLDHTGLSLARARAGQGDGLVQRLREVDQLLLRQAQVLRAVGQSAVRLHRTLQGLAGGVRDVKQRPIHRPEVLGLKARRPESVL
ncbi:hypothetical protein vBPaeSS218_00086 [Pseudomonas phage vB_PaeS_S218]|nr:hypothetical protein vBPaeSS218_00086 [Pseudomonas phage vB_PaeS_S218]